MFPIEARIKPFIEEFPEPGCSHLHKHPESAWQTSSFSGTCCRVLVKLRTDCTATAQVNDRECVVRCRQIPSDNLVKFSISTSFPKFNRNERTRRFQAKLGFVGSHSRRLF